MNKLILSILLLTGIFAIAAGQEKYEFTTVKELKVTPVKNQSRTGTCWSFSGVGLIEAELLRTGKGEYDLSEMFVVNHSYTDKAEKYVRLHGNMNFGQGGSCPDVLYVFKHYGAIPEEVYSGLQYGEDLHAHGEMVQLASSFVKTAITKPNGKLTPVWQKAYQGIIDAYLGVIPETFTYKGKEYTPESFGKSLGLNFDDYVSISSFTHHPFYEKFALEIPDNWRWEESYNVPLDELMQAVDYAIENGYTVAWTADVSESGFTRDGLATLPDVQAIETAGSDQARWVGLSAKEKEDEIKKMTEGPCKEIDVTQALRQETFNNYQTTDDHLMLIYGTAKDQTGKPFYLVKNSWGTTSKYKGMWYASKPYVSLKTINLTMHKDALPKALRQKLGIK
ncbi:MAG: aminopeptidase [Tannerella sp.]|jgi:aminopeptidase C|nr:aminopeptidase [Tannerella sp.]